MGCSSSKDATTGIQPSSGGAAAHSGTAVKSPAASSPVSTSNCSTQSDNSSKESGNCDRSAKKTVKTGQLNDANGDKNNKNYDDRLLSYASGASTPNCSSDDLSWSGESKDGKSVDSTGKPTLYKNEETGSAIDLSDLIKDEKTLGSKMVHIEVPFGRPIDEFYDGVHDGPVLGTGVSGIVRKITHKKTGVEYAVKCMDIRLVESKEVLAQMREEIFIMCQLDHPNIIRLEEVYESHSEIYLVQELCVGGELFDRLDDQPDYHYTEAQCARLVKQMLSAVRYMHSKGIIHRDLKLENFLFSSLAIDAELKLIDFGLSKHFNHGEVHNEAVGTPYTVAPEVILGRYDERCDIWAIGVIAFLLFSGDAPFGGCGGPESMMTVRQNILDGHFVFEPAEIWEIVSVLGKTFVNDLLVTDPKKRPTAREAQKHSWLRIQASKRRAGKQPDNVLNPNVVKALVNFKEFSVIRKLLTEVLSFTLLPDQIKELRGEFEKMDTDGTGEISLDNLKEVLVTNAGAGSLGALTEEEVVDIFNAMRVNKEETTINWHEFIAAGLTQCHVDDRNLRLAFDRLDSDHKGYVALNDIDSLVGSHDAANKEEMCQMWAESVSDVGGTHEHINYDQFLLIMKGQTEKPVRKQPKKEEVLLTSQSRLLDSVSELHVVSEDSNEENTAPATSGVSSSEPDRSVTNLGKFNDLQRRPSRRRSSRRKSISDMSAFSTSVDDENELGESENETALPVTKPSYQARRQIRMSVLEATRRFEEKEADRARDSLMKEQVKEAMTAGLVMRHGTKLQVTTEAIRKYLDEKMEEQKLLRERAHRRSGRGRHSRNKTISDMSSIINAGMNENEIKSLAAESVSRSAKETSKTKEGTQDTTIENVAKTNLPQVDHISIRKATVPGKFLTTVDPFSASGMYGAD